MKQKSIKRVSVLLLTLVMCLGLNLAASTKVTALDHHLISTESSPVQVFDQEPPDVLAAIMAQIKHDSEYARVTLDYPFDNTVFPPDIVAPTFLWHDSRAESDQWLIDISFDGTPYHVYALTVGRQAELVIDPEAIGPTNEHYRRPEYDVSAKAWMPDPSLWKVIKDNSAEKEAVVRVYGLKGTNVLSATRIRIRTSSDPVGAPIFYRDVPLMPSETKEGQIKPISQGSLPLIAWRLRDISKPSAPAVLKDMPTCANCHSFSKDGNVLGMDMDGPEGDKGAYGLAEVSKEMVIEKDDIITWNSYKDTPKGHNNFGLFSQVSPDGRYVVSTLNETMFVKNYKNFEFLQSFYPTGGILVVYDKQSEQMNPLPGADSTEFVQTNACWSPDGKRLVFSRATAKAGYENDELPEYAGDDRETFIQYDLYSIPFNDGMGGVAKPVEGGSKNGMSNSFPKFSPDGKWIVFVKSKKGQLIRPDSRLFIIPAQGGEAREMNCNLDLMNSWHSWSPNSRWLVFSSKGFRPFTQMFLTHIDENGNDTPAVLIPNSTADNRAVNIPEFVNGPGDAIVSISAPTQEAYRLYNNAHSLGLQGKWTQALAVLDESIQINPYYGKAYNGRGFVLSSLDRNDEAIGDYQKALELDPDIEKAYVNLANAYQSQGRSGEAAACLQRGIKYDSKMFKVHAALAELYQKAGLNSAAIQHYRYLSSVFPQSPEYQMKLATALLLEKQYDESLQYFKKLSQLQPDHSDIHSKMGLLYIYLSKYDMAMNHLHKAIELDERNAEAHYNLAGLLDAQSNVPGAIAEYQQVLKIEPEHIETRETLAKMLVRQNQIPAAIEQYKVVLKHQPDNPLVLIQMARLYSVYKNNPAEDPNRAVELAQRACDLTGNNDPVSQDTLATAYAALGDYNQAIFYAQRAIDLVQSSGNQELTKQIASRLELFLNHRRYYGSAD